MSKETNATSGLHVNRTLVELLASENEDSGRSGTAFMLRALLTELDEAIRQREAAEQERDMWMRQAATAEDEHDASEARAATLDATWAVASAFIRDVIEALGQSQPPAEAIVDLPGIALQVVGHIEEFKVRAATAEARVKELEAERIKPHTIAQIYGEDA